MNSFITNRHTYQRKDSSGQRKVIRSGCCGNTTTGQEWDSGSLFKGISSDKPAKTLKHVPVEAGNNPSDKKPEIRLKNLINESFQCLRFMHHTTCQPLYAQLHL
jgi:hypothetical protein